MNTSNPAPITACLVIYNEEAVLERCLTSITKVCQEIIIVHDGACSDRSLEIASHFTRHVIIGERCGISEAHRVTTLEHATQPWVMWIDADEFISDQLAQEILTELPKVSEKVGVLTAPWPLWDGTKTTTSGWPLRPFIFRKSMVSFIAVGHEHFRTTGTTHSLHEAIDHQPKYNNFTLKSFRTKWMRWADVHSRTLTKPFSDIPSFQWPSSDWHGTMRFSLRYPFLFPLYGIYASVQNLKGGAWRHGMIGWKSALLWGMYITVVYQKIAILKIRANA